MKRRATTLTVLVVLSAAGALFASQIATPRASAATPRKVVVPHGAGTARIDACIARARAKGPGTWVVFPAGEFSYSGRFVVPDRISIAGHGIWDQGSSKGGGGTWLRCTGGMSWGSYSTVKSLLVGNNGRGLTCQFWPVPRGSRAAGAFTRSHGSEHCTFSHVRFKGGSDKGASVLVTQNCGPFWSTRTNPLKRDFMLYTTFSDCEFERPQAPNSVGVNETFPGGNPGSSMQLWYDVRPGGAQIANNRWIRCHFGVKNGYHSGIDGYGIGETIVCQDSPSTYPTKNLADRGFNTTGSTVVTTANWNPKFDWSQVTHAPRNNVFTDCLFEYATWYPMDLVDLARSYSMWRGVKSYLAQHPGGICINGDAGSGWGNPPGSHWVDIPKRMWITGWDMTGCYLKGSWPHGHSVVGEIASHCIARHTYCGTGKALSQAGHFGNRIVGTFRGGHPASALFTRAWTGKTTSYTPSPYDP